MNILSLIKSLYIDNKEIFTLISILSSPGGIWFIWDKFRNRLRIEVRNLTLYENDPSIRQVSFELENVSNSVKSIKPKFRLTGYYKGEKRIYDFSFDNCDRRLEPCKPRVLVSRHENFNNELIVFLWFLRFDFKLSNGHKFSKYYLNGELEELSYIKYLYFKGKFLIFRNFPD